MKKLISISLALINIIILVGCTNNKEVEQLKLQNSLLQQQKYQLQNNKEAESTALTKNLHFENNLKCQERGDILKEQYNNFFSVYYNDVADTCYVKYYDNNQMLTESPIESFGPALGISVDQLKQSITLYGGVTYQEVINVLNSFRQPNLAHLIIKMLLEGDVKSVQIIIGMQEGENTPIESKADGYFGQYTLKYLKDTATWIPK